MEQSIVEGKISVKAIMQANRRKVSAIWIDKNKKDRDSRFIIQLANTKKIPVLKCERSQIEAKTSSSTHGGVIAFCEDRQYQNLDEIIKNKNCFLAFIEGVEDPFNFGDICRSLYAAGCNALLLPKRNWTTAVNTITRASAGASEFLDICIVEDIDEALKKLKANDIKVLCAMREHAISLYEYNFPNRFIIAIGGAMRGLSAAVLSHSDQNIYIPYHNQFKNALSSSASSAIIAFEILRQKLK